MKSHSENNQENKSRAAAHNGDTKGLTKSLKSGEPHAIIQQKNIDVTSASDSLADGMTDVVQRWNVFANHGGRVWKSESAFDDKHYDMSIAIPRTDQEWVDWRLERWPGFGRLIPGCTFITGNINTALGGGNYDAPVSDGNNFTVVITVACTTVNPLNAANALTVNNVQITNYSKVKVSGYISRDGSWRINHLITGQN